MTEADIKLSMKQHTYGILIKSISIFFLLTFLISSYSSASEPLKILNNPEKELTLPSKIRLSTQLSTEDRYSFYIDYLLPLYYSKDKTLLFFFNPKQTLHNPYAKELNLGLGLRKAFKDKYILGIHFFYDKKYSTNKVWHYQRGYGLEYLSEPLDIRFNYYDPISKPKPVVDEDDSYSFGQGSLLYWQHLEEPLEGFDFEIGFPLAPKRLNTRLYLGGYLYDSKLSHDQEGLRLRTETKLKKWLSLDTSLNIDDRGQTDFIGGLRVTIPFELTHLNQTADTFISTTQDLSYIQERLFERIVRDIDIQSQSSTQRQSTTTTATNPDGATIGNIIYVDNTNSGTEDGSLSHPYSTLSEAIDAASANDTIYVSIGDGSATGYTGTYTLPDDVVLWGSGYDGGLRGLSAPGYPIIDGGSVDFFTITTAENNTIMGCQIQNGRFARITASTSPRTLNVSHNILTYDSEAGNLMQITSCSENSTITISDNTFDGVSQDNNMTSIYIVPAGNSTNHSLNITGNTFLNCGGEAVLIYSSEDPTIDVTLNNNTFTNNKNNIYLWLNSTTVLDASIYNNTLTGVGICQRSIRLNFWDSTSGTISIYNNTATNIDHASGIFLDIDDEAAPNVSIYRNVIHDTITGVSVRGDSTAGNFTVDLGGGDLGSVGNNSFYDNFSTFYGVIREVENTFSDYTVKAENNWWGTAEPTSDLFNGEFDYEPYLTSDPN